MREIYVARNVVDAKFVCEMLLDAGIQAVVRADPMPVTTKPYPSVYIVQDADAERARELIDEYQLKDGD
jgi:hypothetical protein